MSINPRIHLNPCEKAIPIATVCQRYQCDPSYLLDLHEQDKITICLKIALNSPIESIANHRTNLTHIKKFGNAYITGLTTKDSVDNNYCSWILPTEEYDSIPVPVKVISDFDNSQEALYSQCRIYGFWALMNWPPIEIPFKGQLYVKPYGLDHSDIRAYIYANNIQLENLYLPIKEIEMLDRLFSDEDSENFTMDDTLTVLGHVLTKKMQIKQGPKNLSGIGNLQRILQTAGIQISDKRLRAIVSTALKNNSTKTAAKTTISAATM